MGDYFNEIEGHFAMRRGTPFVLSAKDWALMKKWHDDGVPLPVVIEAIDTVFEKNEASGRRKAISSLSYCKHAVKELWDERRELQVGEDAATPEEAPAAVLEALAAELEASASPAVRAFAGEVRGLAAEKSVPKIESRLMESERDLISKLLESLADEERHEIDTHVAALIASAGRIDEKTRARTEEAHLRRLVREKFALPRLTLFR